MIRVIKLEDIKMHTKDLVEQYHLTLFGVFGSIARGEGHAESDLDIYADFYLEDPLLAAERYFGFVSEMEHRFGCSVQVVTPTMVKNPIFKCSLERDLIVLHG